MDYFLRSKHLGFRCWKDDDLSLAQELWGDPEVTALIGGPFTPEMVRERLAKEMAQWLEYGLQYWPIFLLAGDQHVGCAGLRPYRAEANEFELGFHLRPAFWGRGLARDAASAVIDFGFGTLEATALVAGHHPANAASRHLLLKLGFAPTHEEFYDPTGLMHPMYVLRKTK
jgi:[ribosomal protein S5]-alanine N-acetyltransferase